MDSKKQVPITLDYRYSGWSRQEEGVHKTRPHMGV